MTRNLGIEALNPLEELDAGSATKVPRVQKYHKFMERDLLVNRRWRFTNRIFDGFCEFFGNLDASFSIKSKDSRNFTLKLAFATDQHLPEYMRKKFVSIFRFLLTLPQTTSIS